MPQQVRRLQVLQQATVIASTVAVVVGLLALAGWMLGIDALNSVIPGWIAMNPATAVLFILSGAGLCLLRSENPMPAASRAGAAAATIVALTGIWQLLCDFVGLSARCDRLLFAAALGENRMAPNTALHFVLMGSGVLLLNRVTRRGFPLVQIPALMMLAGSALTLTGYLFGAASFVAVPSFIPMALNTAACFAALAIGLLCARPDRGVVALLASDAAGGVIVRRLAPVAVVIPLVLGWLRLEGEQGGLYGSEFGVALMVAMNVAIFLFAIWWTGRALDQSDELRRRAESELREAHERLETRVEERTCELAAANEQIQRLNAQLAGQVEILAKANYELEQKNRENETFVYSVSHDLRSPLVNLQGFSKELGLACASLRELVSGAEIAEAVRRQALSTIDDDMGEAVRFIQSGVMRLSGIIDSLLRLSRAGRVEYRLERLDVYDIVQRIVESLSGTISDRGAVITIRELPCAHGDATAVEQVFANLISNALKYLDPARPAEIEIGAVTDGAPGQSTYYVRDNGLGIEPAHQEKIFQAFQRVHPQVASGEGMGLAIVRRVVERHGGRIWVESTPGSGSTFFLTLPAEPRDRASTSEPSNPKPELQEQQACPANHW